MELTKNQKAFGALILLGIIAYFLFFYKKGSSYFKHLGRNESDLGGGDAPSVTIYGGIPAYPYGYPYGYPSAFPSGWGGMGLYDPLSLAYEDVMLQKLKPKVCKCGTDKHGRNITCEGKTNAAGQVVCSCCRGERK